MFELAIYADAEKDLDALWESSPDEAADIDALIAELADDQQLLRMMRVHQAREGKIHVSRFFELRAWRMDIWRLKVWAIENDDRALNHRLIYAYDEEHRTFHILGVMHRSQGYEKDKEFTARIVRAYHDLGLPLLGGAGN